MDSTNNKTGEWLFHTFEEIMNGNWRIIDDWVGNGYECSECGIIFEEQQMKPKFKYCPICGSKMNPDSIQYQGEFIYDIDPDKVCCESAFEQLFKPMSDEKAEHLLKLLGLRKSIAKA